MSEPLIWTSRGNVPLASLKLETAWDLGDTYIKFVERYRAEDGEIIKESAHVYSKTGVTGEGVAASLG